MQGSLALYFLAVFTIVFDVRFEQAAPFYRISLSEAFYRIGSLLRTETRLDVKQGAAYPIISLTTGAAIDAAAPPPCSPVLGTSIEQRRT